MSAHPAIDISWKIAIPPNTQSILPTQSSLSIPINSNLSLAEGLESARSSMNTILTEWKDAIAEQEKIKEVKVAKEVAENKARERALRARNGQEDSDDEDDGEEEG